nr:hypothetical protein [Klebsiella variicola]
MRTGDMGKLPDSLPVFLIPDIPLNLDTLMIILPYSAGLAGAAGVDDDRHHRGRHDRHAER